MVDRDLQTHEPRSKILLVDDLPENLMALEALLKDQDAIFYRAESGVEALELILQHDFALALIDVQMPEMSGLELAELMRGSERSRHIPIVFVTAGAREYEPMSRGYEAGAVDFLFKPLDPFIVQSKVRLFLEVDRQKRQIIEQEERFRTTFESAAIGLAHLDLSGKWLLTNQTCSKILGLDPQMPADDTLFDAIHPAHLEQVKNEFQKLVANESSSFVLETRLAREGEAPESWVMLSVSIAHMSRARAYVVASLHDITERKKEQAELLRTREHAVKANLEKSQFLANMSHEIRTPMNAILGFTDLLMDPDLSPEERESSIHRVRANGESLLHIIDDILDLSRFEAGRSQMERSEFSLAEVASDVVHTLSPLAQTKGIKLKMSVAPNVPQKINSDALRVRQILVNILGNGIKFTETGEIDVRINYRKDLKPESDTASGVVEVEVEDTGMGISEEDQQKIFNPFTQADGSISRRFGGTGLGLTLSRRMAQALDGDLTIARSTLGKGTVFLLSLNVKESGTRGAAEPAPITELRENNSKAKETPRSMAPAKKRLEGVRVLLAEDAPDGQALVRHYLGKEGAKIEVAQNGIEALQLAEKFPFDVVLMDMQMPEMGGLEATRRLRERGFKKPIIALTAHAFQEEVERSIAAGCNQHLTKPIDRKTLVQAVEEIHA